jgi:hypothetical protein
MFIDFVIMIWPNIEFTGPPPFEKDRPKRGGGSGRTEVRPMTLATWLKPFAFCATDHKDLWPVSLYCRSLRLHEYCLFALRFFQHIENRSGRKILQPYATLLVNIKQCSLVLGGNG